MRRATGIGGVVDADTDVDGLQGGTCDVVDLTLQERAEGSVHGEAGSAAVGQIHAGGEHRDGNLTAFFLRQGRELAVDGIVFRRLDDELQSHVVEGLGDDHATVERHVPAYAAFVGHVGLGALCGRDVQPGIHGVARKLHITAVLDGEGLQRDDRQRVFHLTAGEGVTACQVDALGVVSQAQVTATCQVGVIGLFRVEVTDEVCTFRHADGEVDIEA